MSGKPDSNGEALLSVTDSVQKDPFLTHAAASDSSAAVYVNQDAGNTDEPDGNGSSVYGRRIHRDSGRESVVRRQFKYPVGTRIDLNAADTTELKKIPGIGSYFAMSIVRYRDRLGGYVSTDQLFEVDDRLPSDIDSWFFVTDTFHVRKLPVNSATLSELRAHPYMNFYKAREIIEYRRQNGDIRNPPQMSLFEEFSAEDMARLEPYLDFSTAGR